MIRLNLGSGNQNLYGFINIDKYDSEADMEADICELPFDDESVDEIVAYQVIEHLPYWKTHILTNNIGELYEPAFFKECYRVMKPGTTMITECPDLDVIARRIVDTGELTYNSVCNLWGEYYRPWDTGRYGDWEHQAGSLHINGFTWKDIQNIAERVGFEVTKLPMDEKHHNYRYEENLAVKWRKLA